MILLYTLILKAIKYFEQIDDPHKLSQAYLEAGRVYEERDSKNLALAFYQKSLSMAEKTNDNRLKGFCAYDYAELLDSETEAIYWFKKSREFFKKSNSLILEVNSLRKIADNYLLDNKIDTAILIYQQCLELIPDNYLASRSHVLKNMAVAYSKNDNQKYAKYSILESIKTAPNKKLYPVQFLILSDVYKLENKLDSANYFQTMAFLYAAEMNDPSILYFAYKVSPSDDNQSESNFLEAHYEYRLYKTDIDSISQNQKFQTIRDVESLYNIEKIKRKDRELIIQKQRLYFSITSIILLGGVLFLFYKKNKNKYIKTLHSDIEKKEEIIDSTKSTLAEKLYIYKQMALWSVSSQYEKYKKLLNESNKLFFQDDTEFVFNIEIITEIINNMHDNFVKKLIETYPQLSPTEIQVCILLKAGFNTSEIASLMNKSSHTIYKYNTYIRKKIDIPHDIYTIDYLNSIFL